MTDLSRRTVLAGSALAEADPAFAAVARARATYDAVKAAYLTAKNADIPEADDDDDAYYDLLQTVPTTVEGIAAVISFMVYASTNGLPYIRCEEDTIEFFRALDKSLRRL